jgi:membrane fusion protein, multidrug efflux system
LLLAAGPVLAEAPAMPAPAVSVAKVLSKAVTQWDEFVGQTEAVETVEIRPRVAGYIAKVAFVEGKEVQKGDLLFVVDQRPFKAKLAQAEAELARARARERLTRLQAQRVQKLLDRSVVARDEFDARLAADDQAKADTQATEAAVVKSRLDLEFTEIRAPIAGRIGRAMITAGNLVSGGEMVPSATLLTTIVTMDPIYVYFSADEQTYLRYGAMARSGERPSSREVANPVFVGLANEEGFPHAGHMNFVDNRLDAATGTIRARAVLSNADRSLVPGLFARIKLLGSGEFKARLIDDKAVLTDQDRKYVYVLGPGNTAMRRDLKVGRIVQGLRIVTEGLTGEELIIVGGVQKVFMPGMPVNPQTVEMGASAQPAPAEQAAANATP